MRLEHFNLVVFGTLQILYIIIIVKGIPIFDLDFRSVVYKWVSGLLTEEQQLDTLGATDVDSFSIGTATYLVFANSRGDVK